jgi:hypothetical protein
VTSNPSRSLSWTEPEETTECNRFEVSEGELRVWTQYERSYDPSRRHNEAGYPQASIRKYEVNLVT